MGKTVAEISEEMSISKTTLYKWKKEYDVYVLVLDYIGKAEYKTAINMCLEYPKSHKIQNKLMYCYIESALYDEAIGIAGRFPSYAPIQRQLMTVYIKKGNDNKVIEIAEMFPKNESIQKELMTVYMKKGNYDKAIEIAGKFPKSWMIQDQLIAFYIKKGNYAKALELVDRFSGNPIMQGKKELIYGTAQKLFNIYIQLGNDNEVLNIAKEFSDDEVFQNRVIQIYIKNGKYAEALEIAGKFPEYEPIQSQLMTVYMKDEDVSVSKQNTVQSEKIDCYELNVIRTKLVANTISMKDIELLDKVRNQIGEKKYNLILAAIYERLNLKKKCIEILSGLSVFGSRKIKKIIQEVKNNKKFYDIAKWDSIIGWSRNEIIDIVDDEKNTPVNLKNDDDVLLKKESKKLKSKEKQPPKKMICSNDILPVNNSVSSSKRKKQVSSVIKNTVYDVLDNGYKDLCFFVQKYLYVKMQDDSSRMGAIKLYDRLEELLCRDSSDEDSKQKVMDFLIRVGNVIANEIGSDDKISSVIERESIISRTRKKDIN